jgi:hypothetical protein
VQEIGRDTTGTTTTKGLLRTNEKTTIGKRSEEGELADDGMNLPRLDLERSGSRDSVGDNAEREVVANDEGEVGERRGAKGGVVFLRSWRDGLDDDGVQSVIEGGMGDGEVAGWIGVFDGERGRDALEGEEGGGRRVDTDVDECGRVDDTVDDLTFGESRRRPCRGGTGVGREGEAEGRRGLARRKAIAPVPVDDSTEDGRNTRTGGGLNGDGGSADEEDGLWRRKDGSVSGGEEEKRKESAPWPRERRSGTLAWQTTRERGGTTQTGRWRRCRGRAWLFEKAGWSWVRSAWERWSTTVDDGEWSEWSEGKGRERGSQQVDLFLITSRNAKHQVLERVLLSFDATSFDSRACCNLSLFDVLRSSASTCRKPGGRTCRPFLAVVVVFVVGALRIGGSSISGLRVPRASSKAARRGFLLKRASSSHR